MVEKSFSGEPSSRIDLLARELNPIQPKSAIP